MTARRIGLTALALTMAACTGSIDTGPTGDSSGSGSGSGPGGGGPGGTGSNMQSAGTGTTTPGTPPPANAPLSASRSALRRLTQVELRTTLRDLMGSDPGTDVDVWPEDARTPFDNDYATQFPSRALVEAAKSIADKAAARLLADTTKRAQVVGCMPSGPGDAACLRQFITAFGRRALRRPLAPADVDRYAAFQTYATQASDFYAAVGLVVRAMLQDLEFLYRIEVGAPVPGRAELLKLTSFEVASRLSYLLWGSAPDDALLDIAAKNGLATPDGVRAAVARMLTVKNARARVDRFHALWLGYERSTLPGNLDSRMQAESNALIDRVVFDDKAPWLELFTRKESFVDDVLAKHYGMTALPASSPAKWVPYGTTGRQGLLSHGTFLSVAGKFNDTSPTQRGKLIRERLLCQEIPPPPPMVNVDEPPKSDARCKVDRYAAHRTGGCAACHDLMDPVGFGLENYDTVGHFRAVEADDPTCAIDGQGELKGVGTFHGPAELENLLIQSGGLERCAVTQLYKFASGRKDQNDDDAAFIDLLTRRFKDGGQHFDQLLTEYAAQPAFGYRIVE